MATANHTPAPWRYEPGTGTIRSVPSNYWLATMDSWDGSVRPCNEANARLIAAAPFMLQILKTIALHAPSLDAQGVRDLADEAIRAATGDTC
jgi:hypothetical protein